MSLMFTETETTEYVVNNRLREERRAWINEMTAESQFSSHSLSKNKATAYHELKGLIAVRTRQTKLGIERTSVELAHARPMNNTLMYHLGNSRCLIITWASIDYDRAIILPIHR